MLRLIWEANFGNTSETRRQGFDDGDGGQATGGDATGLDGGEIKPSARKRRRSGSWGHFYSNALRLIVKGRRGRGRDDVVVVVVVASDGEGESVTAERGNRREGNRTVSGVGGVTRRRDHHRREGVAGGREVGDWRRRGGVGGGGGGGVWGGGGGGDRVGWAGEGAVGWWSEESNLADLRVADSA